MKQSPHRRDFLKATALSGLGFWAGGGLEARPSRSPNEKLNIGVVGCGGKGYSDMRAVAGENIYALCEVDLNTGGRAWKEQPEAKKYRDYREMLEKEAKNLDAVTVSTPDHNHAPASVMAMKLGMHCFCQKPLTHSVHEARVMRTVANEMKVATQMGNQGTSTDGLRAGVEAVQSGAIGDVYEVHVWTNRPIWPQGGGRPKEVHPVPSHLDWDLWLGPAPFRPYNNAYCPFKWRGWSDFGTGALGDMACHTANLPFMALKLEYPTAVEAEFPEYDLESFPSKATIRYDFPARGDLAPVTYYWYDGGRKPWESLFLGSERPNTGSLMIGTKGRLVSGGDYGSSWKLLPTGDFEGWKAPEAWLPRSPGHAREWLDACKGGRPALSDFNYAALLTETILLGNVAIRTKGMVKYDGKNMKVTNNRDADAYLKRDYREGWTL